MLAKKYKNKARVDIIPLVDVLTVLIFFFLITMNFKSPSIVNITPPKMASAGHSDLQDDIVIAINQNGDLFLNDSIVFNTEFEQTIKRSAMINNTNSILIIADENSELKHLAYVLDCCKKHNFNKIRLQAR